MAESIGLEPNQLRRASAHAAISQTRRRDALSCHRAANGLRALRDVHRLEDKLKPRSDLDEAVRTIERDRVRPLRQRWSANVDSTLPALASNSNRMFQQLLCNPMRALCGAHVQFSDLTKRSALEHRVAFAEHDDTDWASVINREEAAYPVVPDKVTWCPTQLGQ
ncbi:hypothetical protein B0G62_10794 [Paraburkholderia eburnea]|uniref:Uncharacterized protein n=1 Tax=Paraburkholderia eburnea TaxID=1189126 RepID=A0A2S4M962_9BURK|nr:hypothetical protein [Paraburkholderia eburnea]POR51067.1 hypothetical protein B0G62_10794 [Paraburkholderia eburnea]PRZ21802.1 hypothetical protein BX588_10894 [Paraburkholderia eburnea]